MRNLIVLIVCAALLVSCQKEVSGDLGTTTGGSGGGTGSGGGGGSATGTRLVKVNYTDADGSSTENINYNAAGQVVLDEFRGISQGYADLHRARYIRDAAGIIQKAIFNPDSSVTGLDSSIYFVHYDATTQHYTSMAGIVVNTNLAMTYKDSTTWSYDASGRVTTATIYGDDLTGGGYHLSAKTVYTYSGNNVQSAVQTGYDASGNPLPNTESYSFEYDARTNPLYSLKEGMIYSDYASLISPNNITKSINVSSNGNHETVTTIYTYNSSNLPLTAVYTSSLFGAGLATYTYQ